MVSFAEDTFTKKEKKNDKSNVHISFASGTKNESLGLIPTIKDNIITYNVGMLKVGFIYKTRLQLIHEFNDDKYDINIPFKHTTNITLDDIIKSNDGHKLILQLHPQNALKMNDYLDIKFIPKKNKKMDINNKTDNDKNALNENKEMEIEDKLKIETMKLKIAAKVLRKEQGTPMLKPGVSCLTKGSMYNTDMSATEWEQ